MNVPLKLTLFREYHKLSKEDIAIKLLIPLNDYKNLENGRAKITGQIAQKLSDLFHAPIEFFIIDDNPHYYQAEVLFKNCTFAGNDASGYINHQYNNRGIDEIIAAKNSEIKTLKQQVEAMQQQNEKLIGILDKQVNDHFKSS